MLDCHNGLDRQSLAADAATSTQHIGLPTFEETAAAATVCCEYFVSESNIRHGRYDVIREAVIAQLGFRYLTRLRATCQKRPDLLAQKV